MTRTFALKLAMSALLATSLVGLAACAIRPAGTVGVTPTRLQQTAQPGAMVVPVGLPRLGERTAQFAYQNGYINALEVLVVDSLGRHQAFLVCRNPANVGMAGGQVNLLFQDVAPGTAWVTVRTTFKQFIGSGLRLEPVDGEPSTFALDGTATHVTAVIGDRTSNVLVFKSADLGGTATAPSVLSFYANNNGDSELNDTSTTAAGYGVGAATGSVVPGNTATVSITVAQPPCFGAALLKTTRHVDAGSPVIVPATNIYPGDRVVVVRADDPAASSDFLDLTKVASYDFYDLTNNENGTITFTPTRSTEGVAVKYYLARGEMVSLIGGSAADVDLAKLHVHPGALDSSRCTVVIGSDDGSSSLPRRADETDTVRLTLRDTYDNLITGADFGARAMESYIWRPAVEPNVTALNNGTNPIALVPGSTIGTLTTPNYDAGTKTWVSTFTQGSTAPTTRGASASFAVAANTNIDSCTYLFDASNVGDTVYTLGVEAYPSIAAPGRLALSMYRGGVVDAAKFIASASYIPPVTPAVAGSTISIGVSPNLLNVPPVVTNSFLLLRIATKPNKDLTTEDNGTRFTPTLGARTASLTTPTSGDSDRAFFRVYKQRPDGVLEAKGVISTAPYIWRQ